MRKILIIEDDPDLKQVLCSMFELEGYRVLTAENGQAAFDMLTQMHPNNLPNIIITDYQMPEVDGAQFIKLTKLLPRLANIPTLIITAVKNLNSEVPVITKPFNIDTLFNTVNWMMK